MCAPGLLSCQARTLLSKLNDGNVVAGRAGLESEVFLRQFFLKEGLSYRRTERLLEFSCSDAEYPFPLCVSGAAPSHPYT